jgi:hypothetical protein
MSEPVDTDPQAAAPELLRRCADDYTSAQGRREQLSREDRVHSNEPPPATR